MKNKNTKIAKTILWFVFYIFISYLLFIFILKFAMFPLLALATGTVTPIINVLSDGMAPEYKTGETLLIKGKFDNVNVDDVVVYNVCEENDCELFISRVININEDGTFSLRGDSNSEQFVYEKNVSKNQILGTPSAVISNSLILSLQALIAFVILFLSAMFTYLHNKRFNKK